MKPLTTRLLLTFVLAGLVLDAAALAPIATVQSSGQFRLDGKASHGSGSALEGSVVETSHTPTEIRWPDGGSVMLQPATSVEVYRGRVVLRQGTGVLRNSVAEVKTLRVSSNAGANAGPVEVTLTAAGRLAVMPQTGAGQNSWAEVRGASGELVARVFPGMPLVFDPQGNAGEPSKVTGCLVSKGASYVLTDTTTNVSVELQGANLSTYTGRLIEATGPMSPNSAAVKETDRIVRASTIKDLGPCPKGSGTPAAGRGGGKGKAAGNSSAAAGHTASVVTIGSIVGGVAVAGTFAGLAAAGTFSGSSSVSPSK